jgi:hypothetical protein
MEHRQAFAQPGVKADVLGSQRWPSFVPPVGPRTFPAHEPSLILRFALLAKVDFAAYGFQQESLAVNLRVLVEVMADALGQAVD